MPLSSPSALIVDWLILSEQTKTSPIFYNIFPPCFPWTALCLISLSPSLYNVLHNTILDMNSLNSLNMPDVAMAFQLIISLSDTKNENSLK